MRPAALCGPYTDTLAGRRLDEGPMAPVAEILSAFRAALHGRE